LHLARSDYVQNISFVDHCQWLANATSRLRNPKRIGEGSACSDSNVPGFELSTIKCRKAASDGAMIVGTLFLSALFALGVKGDSATKLSLRGLRESMKRYLK
jgi:hypothetical protein